VSSVILRTATRLLMPLLLLFALFLLHDVSRIVNGGETNYIMAATGCYISLFNIFANLLHLLMALAGERD